MTYRIPRALALSSALVAVIGCCPCSRLAVVGAGAAARETSSEKEPAKAVPDSATVAETPEASPADTAARQSGWWWEIPYPDQYQAGDVKMGFISVKGNQFVDEKGKPVTFQGVSIADPDKLEREGHWDRRMFEVIKAWGANVVRIPVHPAAWRGLGKGAYFELLDDAVTWSGELGLYVIIDWHSIGNLATGMFQHPMYETTREETYNFWRSVAHRYQGVPTVAFYELFNEPTVWGGTLGKISWDEWKAIVEDIIDIIYAHDKQVIPLVGGFNWAYDLTPVAKAPVARKGIGYVSHPYPQKVKAPFKKKWEADFGFVADTYPLFVTEIGYMKPDEPGAHIPVMDDGSYGKRITDYLAAKGASWAAWCFHPDWAPPLIADWNFTPTESGRHFQEVMKARR
jgi:endoglucanase